MDSCPLQYTAPKVIPATADTRMVKSVTLNGHGQFRRIKVEETPMDDNLKSDHVELNVHYCGLNFTDNYLRLGIIRNSNFPVIMGSECSGIVTRVGKDVQDLQAGNHVICLQMQGGLFRTAVHVPEKHCFKVPNDIDLKDVVAIGLNFLVAHLCLIEFGGLKPRYSVFMDSIGGGVGTAVIELARTVPLVQIYGTASASKHKKLSELRADRVFSYDEDYEDEIRRLHPEGLDIFINTNGGCNVEKAFRLLKRRAMLINIGSNSTAIYPNTTVWGRRPTWDTKYISSAELISKNLSVAGLDIGRFIANYPKLTQKILTEMFDLFSIGEIKPHVHSVLPFDNVVDGITQLCKRENVGKVVLDVITDELTKEDPNAEDEKQASFSLDEPDEMLLQLKADLEAATVFNHDAFNDSDALKF